MTAVGLDTALDALDAAYQQVTGVVSGLGEAELMLPSRCAGWAAADVLYHQLLDARRALRTFATPSGQPPDCDDVSYWRDYAPTTGVGRGRSPGGRGRARPVRPGRRFRLPAWRTGLGMDRDVRGRL